MKKLTLLPLLAVFVSATALNAQVIFDSNVASDLAVNSSKVTISGYTPSSAVNSLLLVAWLGDGAIGAGSKTATFGGNAMTLLSEDARTMIFAYVLSDLTSGDIVIGATPPNNMVVYGTLSGVDTSNLASLSTASGASASGTTLTMDSALTLNSGDFVFAAFNSNDPNNHTGSTPSAGLSELAFVSESSYTAGIYGGTIGSAGSYTPGVTWDGGTGAGSTQFGSAVAFNAIPEPSSLVLLVGALGALGLIRRRSRE